MDQDIRGTDLYSEADALYRALRHPGTGRICDAAEPHAAPGGRTAIFSGTLMDTLEGAPTTRICTIELATGDLRVMTFGPGTDRLPKYSPDGRYIAFLSDRHRTGDYQLYLLEVSTGAAQPAPWVDGWVEYIHWSPDGTRILLGVAGHGADIAGAQGALTSQQVVQPLPSWTPTIEMGDESFRWRRAWVYEVADGQVRQISRSDLNVWEAAWCGNEAIAAVASDRPGEGFWYSSRLELIEVASGNNREIYKPRYQLGWPAASPSGKHLAVVEALCSDRGSLAGDLLLFDCGTGAMRVMDTAGINITHAEWRSDRRLLVAGHRGFETAVGLYDMDAEAFVEVWASAEITAVPRYIVVSGLNDSGDCILVGESFLRAPEIALILNGGYECIRSVDPDYAHHAAVIREVERVTWQAPDGLDIQGWLLRPNGKGPHPLVTYIHGGPVAHWRPTWLGRRLVQVLMMLKRGYAVLLPNPRGSLGRGQDFARQVLGDMGGADTYDFLSGIDHLVGRGIADPDRLAVTGVSYGGFMTSWLITQDSRFAAAVSVSPVTNQVTEHLLSNISHCVALFLADTYKNLEGKYYTRSPIMHAHKVKTPTLNICGAHDRCTPPEEAVQFHNALMENGVESVLLTYPEEGHGVRKFPAAVDYAARVLAWFEKHMSAGIKPADVEGCESPTVKQ